LKLLETTKNHKTASGSGTIVIPVAFCRIVYRGHLYSLGFSAPVSRGELSYIMIKYFILILSFLMTLSSASLANNGADKTFVKKRYTILGSAKIEDFRWF